METLLLYRQLQDQLRQWITLKDQRHLQGFAEMIAAILQSEDACLGEWLPYLSHRDCKARAHMERLSDFVHNQQINAERFYNPLLHHALQAFAGEAVLLTLDTSLLWFVMGSVLSGGSVPGLGRTLDYAGSNLA